MRCLFVLKMYNKYNALFFSFFKNTSLHMQNILLAKHIQRLHIHVLLAARERSFDPVAFNINVFCESHWKHGQNMQLKDDAVYYCARESQHHKPLGDLNFLYWPNSCFFRSPEEALQDHKWILKLCDFFFSLRWILKLILKMSQSKTELTHKFKLCTTFQTRKKEAFACWSKIYFF